MNQTNTKSTAGTLKPYRGAFQMQPSRLLTCFGRVGLLFGLALTLVSGLNAQDDAKDQDGNTQYWQGVLDVGAAKLTLNIEIAQKSGEDGYSAVVYAVEQGNAKIPVDKVEVTNDKITLELNSVKARFEGTIDESGRLCQGTFSQHGIDFDLKLKRLESFNEEAEELIEYWKGTVNYEGTELEMGLKIFRSSDGSLTAKLDSYSQGVNDLPVEFEKVGDTYNVKFAAANLEYSGTLDESKEKLLGTIKQGGIENELDFTRADFEDVPKYNRPQNPKEPLPYETEEVSYENSGQAIKLAGTLTLPPGDGPFPVAITISGSGASDRDGTHFDHKPYLVIADYLTRQGIAVLRFDDRGVGESTGEYSRATSADFATDVGAGVEFLMKHPKIDADRIGLIGHSEGGMIAPMVAADRDDVHFVVLLAGTGVNGGVILKSQSTAMMEASGESDENLAANREYHDAILSLLEETPDMPHDQIDSASKAYVDAIEDEPTRQFLEPVANQLVAMLKSRWVRYFVRHDPATTLAEVECHVLAMNGEKDLQVLCDLNLDPIEKALQEGSPASFEVVRLANMNHMFQETDGSGMPSEYGTIEETFSPKALKIIGDWVKKVTQ